MAAALRPVVIVFNGGSSSGKSSLTRAVQLVLPGTWLRFSVDTLVDACPPSLLSSDGLDLAADGSVKVAAAFTAVEQYWMSGLARMAELGAHLLIEDNVVSGPAAQHRWHAALADLPERHPARKESSPSSEVGPLPARPLGVNGCSPVPHEPGLRARRSGTVAAWRRRSAKRRSAMPRSATRGPSSWSWPAARPVSDDSAATSISS